MLSARRPYVLGCGLAQGEAVLEALRGLGLLPEILTNPKILSDRLIRSVSGVSQRGKSWWEEPSLDTPPDGLPVYRVLTGPDDETFCRRVSERVKNDERDARDLADLLRMGRFPEAWIAPPPVRGLRELVRHRHKLVQLRSGLKSQVHAVLAKCGIAVPVSDLFGKAGSALLADAGLARTRRGSTRHAG
jgi:transposase